jgi:hypothetical protein
MSEKLQPRFESHKPLITGGLALLGIAFIMACNCGGTQTYFKFEPKTQPLSTQTAENGSTFKYFAEDEMNITLSEQAIKNELKIHCKKPLADKEIEVIFKTNQGECGKNEIDQYIGGCTIDDSPNQPYQIFIYPKSVDEAFAKYPTRYFQFCRNQDNHSGLTEPTTILCQNGIIFKDKLAIISSFVDHEYAHLCEQTDGEMIPFNSQYDYLYGLIKNPPTSQLIVTKID